MATARDPQGALVLGGVALEAIATQHGTPTYVYDLDAIVGEARALREGFDGAPHLIAYAVKANSAGPVVRALAAEGCGADVVSGPELALARRAGVGSAHIVFSGVGKKDDEIDLAISEAIAAIQVESVEELARVAARARVQRKQARVSIRLNPEIDPDEIATHSHIATGHDEAKFGIARADLADALASVDAAKDALDLVGLSAHVGSQFTRTDEYLKSAQALFGVARELRAKYTLLFLDTGGGFGVDYGSGCDVRPADFVRATRKLMVASEVADLALHVEPGRALVAAHAVLLARTVQAKVPRNRARKWLVIDAGMNDLIRPALYQAKHRVVALTDLGGPRTTFRVVGPVCESSDDFGDHELPAATPETVALLDAGAYGYTMASRYNGRALASEVFLRSGAIEHVVPRRDDSDWIEDRLR
ncbi:diaminopimelate decarboxylase [soil metagenome]